MKKQSGFTLIELLLVLAIIGIISAIAIPALLSQRARARDKAATENMAGSLADILGQYDKWKESGSTNTFATSMTAYLTTNHSKDRNPWNQTAPAFQTTVTSVAGTTGLTQSAFLKNLTPGSLGQVVYTIQPPTASGSQGFVGGIVKVNNAINGSANVRKAAAIE